MSQPTRIGLVHAVTPAIAPIHAAFARHWPEAVLQDVLDDGLPAALESDDEITPRIVQRIQRLAEVAADGAAGVLFTCNAFDEAIDAARASVRVPLLKPNEAMFDEALAHGHRIGFIATFAPAVRVMETAILARAQAMGIDIDVRTLCVPEAMAAARAGDIGRHDALVAGAVPALADRDVILLAQFSTSTALPAAQAAAGRQPVLSAPDAAVLALRKTLRG
jgi:hypothetical protein